MSSKPVDSSIFLLRQIDPSDQSRLNSNHESSERFEDKYRGLIENPNVSEDLKENILRRLRREWKGPVLKY